MSTAAGERVRRPRPQLIGWGMLVLVAGVLGGWALRTLLSPPADELGAPSYTLVTAAQGTVRQVLRLNTSAVWRRRRRPDRARLGRPPDPRPPYTTAVAVAAILTATLAAFLPAVIASRRDPLHELRVP